MRLRRKDKKGIKEVREVRFGTMELERYKDRRKQFQEASRSSQSREASDIVQKQLIATFIISIHALKGQNS